MRITPFTETERLAIVQALYRMRESLPGPLWVNRNVTELVLDTGTLASPIRRRVSWKQAARMVNGEDWRQVLKEQVMALDPKYIKAIWAAAREHGVDKESVHDAIAVWGLTSVKDLNAQQARLLLNGLRKGGGGQQRRDAVASHGRRGADTTGQPRYMVTPRERGMLKAAAEARGWNDETLGNFIERQLGKRVIATLAEFNKVFWALKAMQRREVA